MPSQASARPVLLQGTLDMLILQMLRAAPRHGYALSQAIRTGSNDWFRVETGSLYPALQRLEKRGLVSSAWHLTEYRQNARVYRLTAKGRRHLSQERSRWTQLVKAVADLMRVGEAS